VCSTCNDKVDLVDTDRRVAGNIVKAGWSAAGGGALAFAAQASLVMGIITYLFAIAAIIAGLYAINSFTPRNVRFTQYLTPMQKVMVKVTSVLGLAAAALTICGVPIHLMLHHLHR
jgi:hypothetical protein